MSLNEGMSPHTYQQFVDETMLTGPSSVEEAKGIKQELDTFLEANGLEINKDKSQVYVFHTPKITRRNIIRILEFS